MSRPRGYDPSVDSAILLGVGRAHVVTDAEKPRGQLAGKVIIPDIDQRGGWREWYVYRDPEPGNPRPLGFRKP